MKAIRLIGLILLFLLTSCVLSDSEFYVTQSPTDSQDNEMSSIKEDNLTQTVMDAEVTLIIPSPYPTVIPSEPLDQRLYDYIEESIKLHEWLAEEAEYTINGETTSINRILFFIENIPFDDIDPGNPYVLQQMDFIVTPNQDLAAIGIPLYEEFSKNIFPVDSPVISQQYIQHCLYTCSEQQLSIISLYEKKDEELFKFWFFELDTATDACLDYKSHLALLFD